MHRAEKADAYQTLRPSFRKFSLAMWGSYRQVSPVVTWSHLI